LTSESAVFVSGCDNMCQSVFKQKSLAVKLVKDSFELYVNA